MPDLTAEEIPQAQEIAYFKALARGNGKEPPPYDPGAAMGDFWQAAGEVIERRAPFAVHSALFGYPGGQAVKLKDPANDQEVGATPEWVRGSRNAIAAYVRGTRPQPRVVFRGPTAANGNYVVGATGPLFGIAERTVSLVFDATTGLSNPEDFLADVDLPGQIGIHDAVLDWYIRVAPAPAHCPAAGTSTHRIATSWRSLATAPPHEMALADWVYYPLMEWTCQWAVGLNDEKTICDAIIANVAGSGLQYGVNSRDLREMLLSGGGMCGIWYKLFQQMAQCQGVYLYTRSYWVDWRQLPNGEEHWCAIVVRAGGLNQPTPTPPPSTFHDNDNGFPIPVGASVPVLTRTEQRYRFWGHPLYLYDAHCINFLVHGGQLYLYDPCFRVGPVELHAPLPADNLAIAQGGADLAPFKAAYLDSTIDYMLGSIWNGATLLQSVFDHAQGLPVANGMTVRTVNIPQTVNGRDGLTFRWGS